MRFLVEIVVDFPAELRDPDSKRRADLLARELARGVKLRRTGTIEHIWRIPGGGLHNVGIWIAEDATTLHELIASLPLYPWIRATVTPLAVHPIEREISH